MNHKLEYDPIQDGFRKNKKKIQPQSLTSSVGTKLTQEQYEAIVEQADAQGLSLSEYVRRTLQSAPLQASIHDLIQTVSQIFLEEIAAMRSIMLNLANAQAKGETLTMALVEEVRAHADTVKSSKATFILQAASGQTLPAQAIYKEAA